jgi:hypothetical protein
LECLKAAALRFFVLHPVFTQTILSAFSTVTIDGVERLKTDLSIDNFSPTVAGGSQGKPPAKGGSQNYVQ